LPVNGRGKKKSRFSAIVGLREGGSGYLNRMKGEDETQRLTGRGAYVIRGGAYGGIDEYKGQTRSVRTLSGDVEPGRFEGLVSATDMADELHQRGLVDSEKAEGSNKTTSAHDRMLGRADPSAPGAAGPGSLNPMAINDSAVAADVDSGRLNQPTAPAASDPVDAARKHRQASVSNIFMELLAVVKSPKVKKLASDPRGKAMKAMADAFERFVMVAVKADGSMAKNAPSVQRAAHALKNKTFSRERIFWGQGIGVGFQ